MMRFSTFGRDCKKREKQKNPIWNSFISYVAFKFDGIVVHQRFSKNGVVWDRAVASINFDVGELKICATSRNFFEIADKNYHGNCTY